MAYTKTAWILATFVLGLNIGCESVQVAPVSTIPDPLPAESYPLISVEPSLGGAIVSDPARVVFKPSDGVRAASLMVPVRSISRNAFFVQYRVLWFDAEGIQDGTSAWKRTRLSPQIEQQFRAVSLSPTTTSWRMEIRVAR